MTCRGPLSFFPSFFPILFHDIFIYLAWYGMILDGHHQAHKLPPKPLDFEVQVGFTGENWEKITLWHLIVETSGCWVAKVGTIKGGCTQLDSALLHRSWTALVPSNDTWTYNQEDVHVFNKQKACGSSQNTKTSTIQLETNNIFKRQRHCHSRSMKSLAQVASFLFQLLFLCCWCHGSIRIG